MIIIILFPLFLTDSLHAEMRGRGVNYPFDSEVGGMSFAGERAGSSNFSEGGRVIVHDDDGSYHDYKDPLDSAGLVTYIHVLVGCRFIVTASAAVVLQVVLFYCC